MPLLASWRLRRAVSWEATVAVEAAVAGPVGTGSRSGERFAVAEGTLVEVLAKMGVDLPSDGVIIPTLVGDRLVRSCVR